MRSIWTILLSRKHEQQEVVVVCHPARPITAHQEEQDKLSAALCSFPHFLADTVQELCCISVTPHWARLRVTEITTVTSHRAFDFFYSWHTKTQCVVFGDSVDWSQSVDADEAADAAVTHRPASRWRTPPPHSLTHSLTYLFNSIPDWSTDSLTGWLTHWLTDWLNHSVTDWLIYWLTESVTTNRLTH